MKSILIRIIPILAALGAGQVAAGERLHLYGSSQTIFGRSVAAKAVAESVLVMGPSGSGAPYIGDFEAGWDGWTSVDNTATAESQWRVSNYLQGTPGDLAAWCGSPDFPACAEFDSAGGYGNDWNEILAYRTTVADPGSAAIVVIDAELSYSTEDSYDYVYLSALYAGQPYYSNLRRFTGEFSTALSETLTYLPSDFVEGTDIKIAFRFLSDGVWSDEDCLYPTKGACQIDDLSILVRQGGHADITSFTDFQDSTFGDWLVEDPVSVGDFAKRWSSLEDIDPCATNYSTQVAFIDDGVVVPGTGGSPCMTWCYGPYGYIVNTTGGLAGPGAHIDNAVESPVMDWPDAQYSGIVLAYDVYEHEDLSVDSPGIFHYWDVRSADTDGSGGHGMQVLADQPWEDRQFNYFPPPGYTRYRYELTSLMQPGRDQFQIRLGAIELGWIWGYVGDDGYPAPYFDNVRIVVYDQQGPAMSASEIKLAQDGFPESDTLDPADLASLHVRFDSAQDISGPGAFAIDPGDSIVARITPGRSGAVLQGAPAMHYVIDANPLFDAYRTTPTSGVVAGMADSPGALDWAFDLPDTGTLFPGDVLHYYIRAEDTVAGDVRAATLPADLSGYGDFTSYPLTYDTRFVVNALPTIRNGGLGTIDVPPILFWNDAGRRGGEDEWYHAFFQLHMIRGADYDVYQTTGPTSDGANGLGARTAGPSLADYDAMFYTAGNLSYGTINDGETRPGNDLAALQTWIGYGDKRLFVTGDNLVTDLASQSAAGADFVSDVLGVNLPYGQSGMDIRPFIGGQVTPIVRRIAGNTVLRGVEQWLVYGGCPSLNTFDTVAILPGAERLAEFTDPGGNAGAYVYSAGTRHDFAPSGMAISLPYDFMYIRDDPGGGSNPLGLGDRTAVLHDVLLAFGLVPIINDVPETARFAVSQAPNPFNPSTRISYTIAAPGRLSLKIYDVRGRLVRTLVDRQVTASGSVLWDGTDDRGEAVASGVYFSEARMGGEVMIGKMALVK